MPAMTLANDKQKDFFEDLAQLPEIALGLKDKGDPDTWSVNAHGRFSLFLKTWKDGRQETLLAFTPAAGDAMPLTPTEEPLVHLHVDWREVRFVQVRPRNLPLIGTTREVVFSRSADPDDRVFWFYAADSPELDALVKKWGKDWVDVQ